MSGARLLRQPLPVVSAAQLEESPPEARWLIKGLWGDQAVGVIGGTPKSYKTWLGLEMAVSVATSTPCLGEFEVAAPGPAMVFLAEDSTAVVRERLAALCHHRGLHLDTLDVRVITAPTLRLDIQEDVSRLALTLKTHKPRLLLLDPFVRLHSADENNAQAVAAILAHLRALQRTYGVAIVVAHHTRKNTRGIQHGQSLRGSGDFHAWVDSALYLTRQRGHLCMTIEHRAAPAPEPRFIDLKGQPPRLVLVAAPDQEHKPSLDERVLSLLRKETEAITRTALRARLAVSNNRLGDALGRLEAQGRARRTSQGWLS